MSDKVIKNRQMKMNFKAIVKGTLGIATVVLMSSCVSDPDSSGLEYMPDMYRSPAIEPYVDYAEIRGRENTELKMKISALVPPRHTIPYVGKDMENVLLMLPYSRKAGVAFKETHGLYDEDLTTEDDYAKAAADKNPLTLTAKNAEQMFKKGKELYTAMCMHCHGEKGDGNGKMMENGTYAGVPNYTDRASLGDGQIFYSIYYGKNAMGAHSSMLNKKEIWTLVHYVRQFMNPEYGKFNADGSATVAAAPAVSDSLTK
ncbi:MAG: c-type cytochrome [Bacteroidota bacterium]